MVVMVWLELFNVIFELDAKVRSLHSPFCRVAFASTPSWGLGIKFKLGDLCFPSIYASLKLVILPKVARV